MSEVVSSDLYYYADWEAFTCSRKQDHEFKYWETDKFSSLDECCNQRFGWDYVNCCNTPGMGGCTVSGSVCEFVECGGGRRWRDVKRKLL